MREQKKQEQTVHCTTLAACMLEKMNFSKGLTCDLTEKFLHCLRESLRG